MKRMASLDFKQMTIDYGERVVEVDEALYALIHKETPVEEMLNLISQAKALFVEYENIIKNLDEHMGNTFIRANKDHLQELKETLQSVKT